MLECREAKSQLSPFLDGELPRETRASVAAHLQQCPDCSLHYEELKRTQSDLKSLVSSGTTPSETFTEDLLRKGQPELRNRRSRTPTQKHSAGSFPGATRTVLGLITLVLGLWAGTYLGFGFIEAIRQRPFSGTQFNQSASSTGSEVLKVVSFNDAFFELDDKQTPGTID
ncbi:MAG: anti-sigma factor [bacterium]